MGLNMLVAFDDSDNAMRAVEFIVKTFNSDSRVTLFYVVQDSIALCDMNSPELTPYFLTQQCSLRTRRKKEGDGKRGYAEGKSPAHRRRF